MEPMLEGPTIPIPWGARTLVIDPTDAQWFGAEIAETLSAKGASFWLKRSYDSAVGRDPVDALRDAETLVQLLKARLQLLKSETPATIWNSDGIDEPALICPPPRGGK
jgi:hypothetical protein